MTAHPETSDVRCAFCDGDVDYTTADPIGIGVVEQWRPGDEDVDWFVYGHRQCLIDRLSEATRAVVEL